MNRIAKFEKVSFEQYLEDYIKLFPDTNIESQDVLNQIKTEFDAIQLPKRTTAGSAGYDFYAPFDFTVMRKAYKINALESSSVYSFTHTIPTGIRCRIDQDWVLQIYPRSSLGFKYQMGFANNVPIIDSDYYYATNEGHIMLKVTNNGNYDLSLKAGDRFAQGIFLPYGITEDDDVSEIRTGGFGSTGA